MLLEEIKLSKQTLEKTTQKITQGLKTHIKQSHSQGFIVGLSGGIDSAVTATLISKAKINQKALILPEENTPDGDVEDAINLAEKLRIKYHVIDISQPLNSVSEAFPWGDFPKKTPNTWGNVKPRIRMTFFYLAANLGDYLVAGTGNKTELLLGYFTKHGDGASDILPIGELYKMRVFQLARFLKLDQCFLDKTPTAGLWPKQTDEKELGLDYETLDSLLYLLTEQWCTPQEAADKLGLDKADARGIARKIQLNRHKLEPTHIVPVFD
ncbi:MAG: NAD+ synthase [Candidatus Altiarchaeales archaeon]|nr:NAD+ synthase [Candidatus Altiarchaeales archaeon]